MSPRKQASDEDVQSLRNLLSGTSAEVYGPSDNGYAATLERWSRAAEKPSGVSVVPRTAEEIAVVVKYTSEHGLDLAVKGGGHSTSGASSTNGGILINLGQMRNVRVDPGTKLLYVQGGCLWEDVDRAAWEHGLATVGGTVADTGVGGLSLGGGYGHLTGKHGLVIDNMVGATTVVASGEIIKSSNSENSDLFWGLLGAGQNFGITTEFVFRGHPQSEIYCGMMVFPPVPAVVEKVVAAANDLFQVRETANGPETKIRGRSGMVIIIARPPQEPKQTVLLCLTAFDGTEQEGKEVLRPFFDIGPIVNTLAPQPYPKANSLFPTVTGARVSMKGASFMLPLRADFVNSVIAKCDDFTSRNPDAAATGVAFEFYDPIRATQLEAGSFANRGYHLNGLVMPMWQDPANDALCRQWARDVSSMFKTELEASGESTGAGIDGGVGRRGHKGAVMLYGNYDQYDEISKDIFGDNYEPLQKLKAKYDPTNMFNKLMAITPAKA